jgi:cell division septation protein DedD
MKTMKHFCWVAVIALTLLTIGLSIHAEVIFRHPYAVQVGVSVNYENAEKFANIVKSNEYNPWIRPYLYNDRTSYGVYLGAFESREKAENFAQSVKEKLPHIINDYVIIEMKQNQSAITPSQNKALTVNPTAIPTETKQKAVQTSIQVAKNLAPIAKSNPTIQPSTQLSKKPDNSTQYVIRVGVFVNYENAKNLVDALKSDKYSPSLKAYSYKGKTTYWVYAGALESKEKAENFAQSMRKRLSYIDDYVIIEVKSETR